MSVISKIRQLAKLKRKPYRDAYVGEHVKTSLPFQIRTLREQRGLSQRDLGERTGMRQNAISRLEKPDYGSLSVNTLLRLASAFDVALLIKFVPFRKLLDEFSDLSIEALEVNSFDDELPELENVAAITANTSFVRPTAFFYGGGEIWTKATVGPWFQAREMAAFDHDLINISSAVYTLDRSRVERMLSAVEHVPEVDEVFAISKIPTGNMYLDSSSTQVLAGVM